ncbi:MAG: hypothetical protein KC493_07985 [Bacteriovoracaceae bacterium]|nr:hypothetical protein [Bacteriovoracaceae bacterium]
MKEVILALVLTLMFGTPFNFSFAKESLSKEVSLKSKDIEQTSNELRKETENLFLMMRQKEASDVRAEMKKELLEADNLEQKIVLANTYFQSFEYQLWLEQEGQEKRDELVNSALEEFIRLYREIKDLNSKNGNETLDALSIMLHTIHPHQDRILRKGIHRIDMELALQDIYEANRNHQNLVNQILRRKKLVLSKLNQ